MRIRSGARTDVGVVRDHNEDAYLAEAPIFAVADGMGGHQGGEVASRIALETVAAFVAEGEGAANLAEAVLAANRAVLDEASTDQGLQGMGTTLTVVRTDGRRVTFAHVGDSRAYLVRRGELRQLTEDHTLVHKMVREGKITEDEAAIHPHRSILTRALGVEAEVAVDQGGIEIEPGDRMLLCSDGLTGMVPEDGILETLNAHDDPQAAADALVRAANEGGGQDNITVVILDLLEGREEPVASTTAVVHMGDSVRGAEAVAADAGDRRTERLRIGRRRRIRGVLIGLSLALGILLVASVGVRLYVDTQWFVGIHEDRVALYRGVPTEIVGLDLFSLVEVTGLQADDARRAGAPWGGLPEGITAGSESEAREIIDQIERDLSDPPP